MVAVGGRHAGSTKQGSIFKTSRQHVQQAAGKASPGGCTLTTAEVPGHTAELGLSNRHAGVCPGLWLGTVSSIALLHWAWERMESHLVMKGIEAAWTRNRVPQKFWAPSPEQVVLWQKSGCQPNGKLISRMSDLQ